MDDRTDSQLRRKLITGSLSAPLVLTVGKAHAVVARGTYMSCLSKSAMQPEPLPAVAHPDEALRVTRDVYEIHQSGPGRRQKLEGRYIVGWDNETVFRLDGDGLSAPMSRMGGLHARSPDLELRVQGKVELLAYLDDHGNVVGFAPQSNGGLWTMKSCYMSFAGHVAQPKRWWG